VLAVGQLHLSPETGRLLPDEAHVLAHARGALVLNLKERRQRDRLPGVSAWPAETLSSAGRARASISARRNGALLTLDRDAITGWERLDMPRSV
jgi:hypothetical protein